MVQGFKRKEGYMVSKEQIQALSKEIEGVQKVLIALGDSNRQHLIIEMMNMGQCGGVRVEDIASKSNLSRPAVSHHLKILKEAGIIDMRKEGTKHFYYFRSTNSSMGDVAKMATDAKKIMEQLPYRGSNDD
jgi:DNA-binding transcriptional ArsR family regulator